MFSSRLSSIFGTAEVQEATLLERSVYAEGMMSGSRNHFLSLSAALREFPLEGE